MTILNLKHICKEYNLEATNYISFLKDIYRLFDKKKNYKHKLILDNINFEIKKGQSVALLGKNGSGKSTLLKIIAKIAHPNKGELFFKQNCKIASMLSVLTSLEPEFSGYENIFFLGAGMNINKNFLKNKSNEIISYADLQEFKETPLKRYSTGMRIRLCFSICLHVNCDLMLADEILIVSDNNFKEKVIRSIKEKIKNRELALIFVSHDRELNKKICDFGVVLDKGKLSETMLVEDAYKLYDHCLNSEL